jgi:hypothetical protein
MDRNPQINITLPQGLLALAAFLIPILGGQISTDKAQPLLGGLGPFLVALLGGPWLQGFELPLLTHWIIGLLIGASLIVSLFQRKVIQLPNVRLVGLALAFFGLLAFSIGLSDFRFVSMAAFGEWLLYALAIFTTVAVAGRSEGPKIVLAAFFVGVAILAIYGIGFEYRDMRAIDPHYRIFAGWVNPNATAGILTIGLMTGYGLLRVVAGSPRLLVGLANIFIGVAIFLTGSKAGFGALLVGTIAWVAITLLWPGDRKDKLKWAAAGPCALVLSFGVYAAIQRANAPAQSQSGVPFGRIAAFGESQAQSLEFRKLLWKGSLKIAAEHPTGYGLGTYRYEGSRPGFTTQTQLAHNSLLQLATEASFLAPIILATFLLLWFLLMFRGAKSMPENSNALRAAVIAGIAATLAQGLFESNLYYFGIGLSTFILLGLGLNLSADSVAPEFTPKGVRTALALLSSVPLLILAYFGYAEYQHARIVGEVTQRNFSAAKELATSLVEVAPLDGEAWNILAKLDPSRRREAAENAARLQPSPKILRSLAEVEQADHKYSSAEGALNQALLRDPNNLNTLGQALENSRAIGDLPRAKYYAERMVAVEKTPYFKIRSLPELVEVSTADARVYLAGIATDPKSKADLLQGALDFYRQYALITVPQVHKFAKEDMDFGGESSAKATETCRKGIHVAKQLAAIYRETGATDKSTAVAGTLSDFEGALAILGGNK